MKPVSEQQEQQEFRQQHGPENPEESVDLIAVSAATGIAVDWLRSLMQTYC